MGSRSLRSSGWAGMKYSSCRYVHDSGNPSCECCANTFIGIAKESMSPCMFPIAVARFTSVMRAEKRAVPRFEGPPLCECATNDRRLAKALLDVSCHERIDRAKGANASCDKRVAGRAGWEQGSPFATYWGE